MDPTPAPRDPEGLELGGAPPGFRSGFVSLTGRPNVGKSTLLNQLLRTKVSIISDRPQTTRNAIRGILTTPEAQVVFIDTPGLHKPHTALGKRLNRVVRDTVEAVDVILFMVDAAEGVGAGDGFIAKELEELRRPVLVALNKLDAASPAQLQSALDRVRELGPWETFGISARVGTGTAELLEALIARLPEGPLYYPADAVTDQPERQLVAELIREKALALTREEVPHSVAVAVEEMESDDDGDGLTVTATIYVERDSQKGIVIGRGGKMLKEIGTRARKDIEALLGSHVYLDLRVKVERDWQRRDSLIARFGYGE